MTTTTQSLSQAGTRGATRPLAARLTAALDGFLDRRGELRLICGDADSSLLAVARDLQAEDQALCGRFGR